MKRRWFQIHLSTAVALMFVAGIIVCLNVSWHGSVIIDPYEGREYAYGWPVQCFIHNQQYCVVNSKFRSGESQLFDGLMPHAFMKWIVPNVVAALGILAAVALVLEWRIRRRERCRLPQEPGEVCK